ncbi:hypothetical protein LINPERPRIM_LOCUS24662 [Linum perenne]
MRVELRAAAIGLKLAWNLQATKVQIQIDSHAVVLAITGRQVEDARHQGRP